ncbi:MAG TPA: hypothetical protein VGE47_16100 [Burkholderiaceae bacterium]
MCDDGVFIVGDTAYSYEDIAVESTDAIALNDKDAITAYGYPELFALRLRPLPRRPPQQSG